jgi:hypothetical protein
MFSIYSQVVGLRGMLEPTGVWGSGDGCGCTHHREHACPIRYCVSQGGGKPLHGGMDIDGPDSLAKSYRLVIYCMYRASCAMDQSDAESEIRYIFRLQKFFLEESS